MTSNVGKVLPFDTTKKPLAQSAMIKTFNNYIPIKDYKQVDGDIWVGEIITPEHVEAFGKTIYFSRKYDPANTIDQMIREYHIKDLSLLGFEFILISKEKALFQYEPASTIIRPVGNFKKIKN